MIYNTLKYNTFISIIYIYFIQSAIKPLPFAIHLLFAINIVLMLLLNKSVINIINKFPKEMIYLLIFYMLILVPGIYFSNDLFIHINRYLLGINYIFLAFTCYYIVKKDNSIIYFINTFIVLSIIYTIYLSLFGVEVGGNNRLAINEDDNPNAAGMIIKIGILSLLYYWKRSTLSRIIITLLIVSSLPYLFSTGSRKAFYAILIFIILFYIIEYYFSKKSKINNFIALLTTISIIFIVIYNYSDLFIQSKLFERIESQSEEGMDLVRKSMYADALDIFLSYPLFGVGYWNFAHISNWNTYTHSTYAEVIVTGGILGSILWFAMYYIIYLKFYRIFKKRNRINIGFDYIYLVPIFVVLLFYGFTTAQIYEPIFYIYIGIISGYLSKYINFTNIK